MSLYAYCRVSTLAQAEEGESLEIQGRQCEGWALMRGQTIGATFVEKGVSGSVPIKERTAGAKLWAKLEKGDTIVAAKLDRMFRDARDALNTVEELKQMGVSLVLLDLGTDPVTNGLSQLFLTIVAAFANMERERIRERIQGAKADAKARGMYLGGKLPYGFRKGPGDRLEPVPEEQRIIAKAKALRGQKMPLRAIQMKLADDYGRRLSLATLSRILGDEG